jgi:hypothetical protein
MTMITATIIHIPCFTAVSLVLTTVQVILKRYVMFRQTPSMCHDIQQGRDQMVSNFYVIYTISCNMFGITCLVDSTNVIYRMFLVAILLQALFFKSVYF